LRSERIDLRQIAKFEDDSFGALKRLQFIIDVLLERYGQLNGLRILDIGCGTGELVSIPLGKMGALVCGVDIDEKSIEHAKRNCCLPNVSFFVGTVEGMPNSSYDVCIASEVLEHVPNPLELLVQAKAKIDSHGVIIITVPNGLGSFEVEHRLWGLASKILKVHAKPARRSRVPRDTLNPLATSPHIHFFTYHRFLDLLERAGLQVVRFRGRTFLGGPVSSLLIQKRSLVLINDKLGTKLPPAMVSGWMFCVEPSRTRSNQCHAHA